MKYDLFFTQSHTAFVLVNDHGQIILTNAAAQNLLEYEQQELTNFDLFKLIPEHLVNLAQDSWQKFLNTKQQTNFTIIKTKNQKLRYVSFCATANIEPGIHFASVHPIETHTTLPSSPDKGEDVEHVINNFLRKDLLQRAATQDYELSKLIAAEKHFYSLFKNLPIPIIESDCSKIKDILTRNEKKYGDNPKQYFIEHPAETNELIQHCTIREINKAALRFFKISNKITSDEDLIKIYAGIVNFSAPTIFDGFLKNAKNIMYETEVNDYHGQRHSVIMRVSAESDNYARTFVTFEDISATKKIQAELESRVKERTVELEFANKNLRHEILSREQAEEQLKKSQIEMAHFARVNAMGEVASGIAHELNQPLTAISNFMSGCKRRLLSLTDQKIPQDILDAIENAAVQAQRAGNIIHNLKDFLRKGELSKQKFNLNSAIQDVIIFSKKSVFENKITIKLKLEKNLPQINADKIHIEQVILNIVNNAIDAINESKRPIKEIIIRTKLYKSKWVRISICDSGMGITKDLIHTIFNPFMTTKPEGMGIGLSLCHNIIDKHQGTISVVSRRGKGAIFHITLPVE